MISKTMISRRMKKKTNSELAETIFMAKKLNLIEIAGALSTPARKMTSLNLKEIDKEAKDGETIIVPGKVLGKGDFNKKIKVIALSFSSSAEEKLKKAKCSISTIKEEMEKSKKLEGKILR